MKYIYLDHNIFIETLYNENLKEVLKNVKADKNITFLYSPAHIEEVYKVAADVNSSHASKMKILLENISHITDDNEFFPTHTNIIVKKENPLDSYKRVKSNDTREIVKSDSTKRFQEDDTHYKNMLSEDRHNKSISTIEFYEIWDNKVIKQILDELNNNISKEIYKFNSSFDNKVLKLLGIDKQLSSHFCFKKGNHENLKNSFCELEYTIEILFRVLNYCGYNADKSEKTNISGTHDVTHGIYATKSHYLVSTDSRFVKKCKAVYHYLGVKTEVIYVKQEEIIDCFKTL